MGKLLSTISTLAAMTLLAPALWARSWGVDLRPEASTPARAPLRAAKAAGVPDSVFRRAVLPRSSATGLDLPLAPGDTLSLTLFDDVSATLLLVEQFPSRLSRRVFSARTADSPFRNATVVQTETGFTASIRDAASGHVFRVYETADGDLAVEEAMPVEDDATECAPPVPPATASARRAPAESSVSSGQASALVDVMVVFDQGALEYAEDNGGATNIAETAVQTMNLALANSDLSSLFRFRLVDIMFVSTNVTDIQQTLYDSTDGIGAWSGVAARRQACGADVVSCLIDTGSSLGVSGIGWSLDALSKATRFADHAYSCCSVRNIAQGTYTMAHEVGHNMGAGHSNAPGSPSPGPQMSDMAYSSGYHFTGADGGKYHTVMGYSRNDGDPSYYSPAGCYSSPLLTFAGVAAGTAASNDNRRVLLQTYPYAVNWRPQVIPLSYDVFFSPPSGAVFSGSLSVTLTPGLEGADVHYTLDGTEPTLNSPLYAGPITITGTTTIRAATVTDGVLGPSFSGTYTAMEGGSLGDGVDAPQLQWTTEADSPWRYETDTTFDGVDAVVSGELDFYHSSSLHTTVTGPTTLSFRYKSFCYASPFTVTIGANPVFSTTDRAADWTQVSLDIPAGEQDVTFSFMRQGTLSGQGAPPYNCVWIDSVSLGSLPNPPDFTPAGTLVASFPASVALSNPNPAGAIYYTLDGTVPTFSSGVRYAGPVEVASSNVTLTAAVLGNDGSMSPVAAVSYHDVASVLGTTGITWSFIGDVGWKEDSSSGPGSLRSGRIPGSTYTSTLQGVFSGPGTLSFKAIVTSYSYQNGLDFYQDNTRVSHSVYSSSSAITTTNLVSRTLTGDGETVFRWIYNVGDSTRDYDYSNANCGAWLKDVVWEPVASETGNAYPVPFSWLEAYYPNSGASSKADYTALGETDSDGDGFLAWQEYVCGSDPTNSASYLRCFIQMVNGGPVVTWSPSSPLPDVTYTVEGRERLDDPTVGWSEKTSAHRFFRVRVSW